MAEAARGQYTGQSLPMQALSMEERQKVLPAYTVTPLQRKIIRNIAIKDELGFRSVPKEEVIDGYMVRTLRGDSVFVTHDELVRMKLDKNLVPMVVDGGDDTAVAMQSNHPALSDQQRNTLDMLSKLVERDPALLERLLTLGEAVSQNTEQEEE